MVVAILSVHPAVPATKATADRTTEALRAEVFGADRAAADLWVQINAFVRYGRWREAADLAHHLLSRRPTALIRSRSDRSLYLPARSAIAVLLEKHAPFSEACRQYSDPQAAALLSEFRREGRLEALREIAKRFPFSTVHGEALRLLADGLLDRCDFERAASAFALMQTTLEAADEKEAALWACKRAWALLQAGRIEEVAAEIADIRDDFGRLTISISGRELSVADYCQQLMETVASRRATTASRRLSAGGLAGTKGWSLSFARTLLEAGFRRKYRDHFPYCEPAYFAGAVYATDGNSLWAVEFETGKVLWKWMPDRPGRFNLADTHRWLEWIAPTSLRPAINDRHVLALRPIELSRATYSVCCLDRRTGRLIWQRVAWSDEHESAETAPVAAGQRAYTVVSSPTAIEVGREVVSQRAVVCFKIDTAELVWRTVLPIPGEPQPLDVPGSVVGPVVAAGRILVLDDRGTLYCLDRGTGEIAWVRATQPGARQRAGRPGRGLCVVAGDGAIVSARGGSQLLSVNLRSGRLLWSKDLGWPIEWLATDGRRILAVGERLCALSHEDGAISWEADLEGDLAGPGCVGDGLVLVPTERALLFYETATGRLVDQIGWPEGRPLAYLKACDGGIVGMSDDMIRKLGEISPSSSLVARPAGGEPEDRPGDIASVLFAKAELRKQHKRAGPLATVGFPLVERPERWVVFDPREHNLRCYGSGDIAQAMWESHLEGAVRAIEFDRRYVYIWCDDRVEIRDISDEAVLVSKKARPTAMPRFGNGCALWTYRRGPAGSRSARFAGERASSRDSFDVSLAELGLTELRAFTWTDDKVFMLGERKDGKRVFAGARLEGRTLKLDGRPIEADSRISSVDFERAFWETLDDRLIVYAPETGNIYCYSFADGKRVWKCYLEARDRPPGFMRVIGRKLIWYTHSGGDRRRGHIGVADANSGRVLWRAKGERAFAAGDRLYVVWGPYLRVYATERGRLIREVSYAQRAYLPAWVQPLGDAVVVAAADPATSAVREAALADRDLRSLRGSNSRTSLRIPTLGGAEIIEIDGWTDDWDRVGMAWQELTAWHPAAGVAGSRHSSERSAADLRAQWKACTNNEALYLVVVVDDDRVVPNRWSDCPWIGDSIEVGLSGGTFVSGLPTFCFSLEGPGQCWAAGPRLPTDYACVRYDPLDRRLVYEIAFPWDWLRRLGIKPQRRGSNEMEIALALAVYDDDGEGLEGGLAWGVGLVEKWNPFAWNTARYSRRE